MSKDSTVEVKRVPLTISIVSDSSNWPRILDEALPAMEKELTANFGVEELFLGHDMTDPNQLYLFLYGRWSKKYYIARCIDKHLQGYLSNTNLPTTGNSRIGVSLWMPYPENTIKYGLFFVAEESDKLSIQVYSAINKINRTLILDASFCYDILMIRTFSIIYLTTIFFEDIADNTSGKEFLETLYDSDHEPFEELYEQEKDLFQSVVEQINLSEGFGDLGWISHWKDFLHVYAHNQFFGLPSSKLKDKFYKVMAAFFTTNRLPSTERASLVVAASNAIMEKRNVLHH